MALLQVDDLLAGGAKERNAESDKELAPRGIEVTLAAVERIHYLIERDASKAGQGLRIYVTNGGCAGYSYGMAFDHPAPDDKVTVIDGLQVMVDPESWPWLQSIKVDYKETLMGSGFSITNPVAASSCGCGSSFSKGDGAPTDNC
jgi:iron-sulfur cluster assembly accessory protein